jgi:glycosyltransferase involved in cell wall biosynthesis
MARVLLNALASTAGGGITYLRNVLPRLTEIDQRNIYISLTPPEQKADYAAFSSDRLRIETAPVNGGLASRLWWEQTGLRSYLKLHRIDALVSLGNFALYAAPVPQILFNRNDLYFSDYFTEDLKERHKTGMLLNHVLKSRFARASIKWADLNVAPTKAFADRIRSYPGLREERIEVLPFGFADDVFGKSNDPLTEVLHSKLNFSQDCDRLLFVSHYNYFRNFETLIRALPMIKTAVNDKSGRKIQLVLTTDIRQGAIYGGYDATAAAELIDRLGVRSDIAMLGAVPYDQLRQLYRMCEVFVCPSYSESFGHPLVEAMACGLPVVSANLPVHREICEDAAIYFDVFDERALAAQCVKALSDSNLRTTLKSAGAERIRQFSWDRHTRGLVNLIEQLLSNK